jgi:hypothetical protein
MAITFPHRHGNTIADFVGDLDRLGVLDRVGLGVLDCVGLGVLDRVGLGVLDRVGLGVLELDGLGVLDRITVASGVKLSVFIQFVGALYFIERGCCIVTIKFLVARDASDVVKFNDS